MNEELATEAFAFSRKQVRRMEERMNAMYEYVNKELIRQFERGFFKPPHRSQRLKLLKLWSWSRKHKVTVAEVLSIVVPYWDRKKSGKWIGIPINSLVSYRSEQILKEKILWRYPNGENLDAWRANARKLYLQGLYVVKVNTNNPLRYASEYRMQIMKKRRVIEKKFFTREFERRHYPENPWIW